MMGRRHELRLIGITYNQIESGVYALILEEVGGRRRIPIIIGYPEAQAIECKLQEVVTPRPLTHDLIKQIFDVFNLKLLCVEIRKLSNGVFAAWLVMEGPDGSIARIDSRSSDAIAVAIRTGASIYTSSQVLDEAGFSPRSNDRDADKEGADSKASASEGLSANTEEEDFSAYTDSELREQIELLAKEERYEEAAKLQAVLRERENGNGNS